MKENRRKDRRDKKNRYSVSLYVYVCYRSSFFFYFLRENKFHKIVTICSGLFSCEKNEMKYYLRKGYSEKKKNFGDDYRP
jgi:hypothetical protein